MEDGVNTSAKQTILFFSSRSENKIEFLFFCFAQAGN